MGVWHNAWRGSRSLLVTELRAYRICYDHVDIIVAFAYCFCACVKLYSGVPGALACTVVMIFCLYWACFVMVVLVVLLAALRRGFVVLVCDGMLGSRVGMVSRMYMSACLVV